MIGRQNSPNPATAEVDRPRAISISCFRSFSFSDNSANVAPLSSLTDYAPGYQENLTFGKVWDNAIDPQRELLGLRQIESSWYQALFQSNRNALMQPWKTRTNALADMNNWASSIGRSTPLPIKSMYRLEVLCGNILLIWPVRTVFPSCAYGKALVFDYAVEYMKTLWMMYESREGFVYCDNIGALRTITVGERLLDVLEHSRDSLFGTMTPQAPSVPEGYMLPPLLQRRGPAENVKEAIASVTRLGKIIDVLVARFHIAKNELLKSRSSAVLHNLNVVRQQLDSSAQYISQPPSLQALHGSQSQSDTTTSWDPRMNTTRHASY